MRVLDHLDHLVIEPALRVLDSLRGWMLKGATPVTRGFVRQRDLRAVALAAFACGAALVISVRWTGYLLLLGPLVFGAPHLVAEARYLFFQRHRSNTALLAVLLLQAVLAFGGVGIYGLGVCCALAILTQRVQPPARGERAMSWGRDAALLGAAALMQTAAMIGPSWSRFALLHVHNGVSLLVWLVWRKRPHVISMLVGSFLCAGILAIMAGSFDHLPVSTPFRDSVFSLTKITDAVAAGFDGPWRHRFLMLFCFMQSAHYAIWVRLLPEEARARETPRPWLASWRAFKADCGPNLARLAVLGAVAVPVMAFVLGPVRARSLYVTASEFHATVEMVLIFLLFRRTREESEPSSPVLLESELPASISKYVVGLRVGAVASRRTTRGSHGSARTMSISK